MKSWLTCTCFDSISASTICFRNYRLSITVAAWIRKKIWFKNIYISRVNSFEWTFLCLAILQHPPYPFDPLTVAQRRKTMFEELMLTTSNCSLEDISIRECHHSLMTNSNCETLSKFYSLNLVVYMHRNHQHCRSPRNEF